MWGEKPYTRPAITVPPAWQKQNTGTGYLANANHWWDAFGDPRLSSLISQVLTVNNDLAKAGIQLKLAQTQAGLTRTNLTPDASANANANNNKNIKDGSAARESYSAAFSLSYELDLWGKLARTREQAQWQVNATEQDKQATALTLIGQTAQLYWQIASQNQQIVNQQRSLEIAKETLTLTHHRYATGAVTQMDVIQAEQSVISRENTLRDLQTQREEARNTLAVLFNRPPSYRVSESKGMPERVAVPVASRLPVEMIAQRPDVQAAEWRLRAALVGSDVARLSFYPTLSLSAGLNAGSAIFDKWFSEPTRGLGSSVALPFIEWNKVQLTIEQSDLQAQQAEIEFRDSAYRALSEVDTAMAKRLNAEQQLASLERDFTLSQQRLTLATQRYDAGAIDFQELLDAQDALLASQNALLTQQYNYLFATMQLWLALGGGNTPSTDRKLTHE